MVLTALSVTEMALSEAGVNIRFGSGVAAAQTWFSTGRRVTDTPAIAAA
jgi:alanine-glyoxylate transaminase / serine-glyoxylate transaminase / serine-pyruvate transaminase